MRKNESGRAHLRSHHISHRIWDLEAHPVFPLRNQTFENLLSIQGNPPAYLTQKVFSSQTLRKQLVGKPKMALLTSPTAKSVAAYGAISLFTSLIGKIIVTKFFFDYPIVILMLQNSAALFAIELLRVLNVVKLAPYTFDKGRHFFLPSVLLAISSWLTLTSYEGIGMPAFDAVKRFSALFALVGVSMILKRQRVDQKNIIGIIALCIASSFAVNFEMIADRFSLFYGVIAAVLQASAYIQLESLSTTFQPLDILYMQSFNSLVVFLLADIVQDEIRDAFMYMMTSANALFTFVLFVLLIAGIALQYSTYQCIASTGAVNVCAVANIRSAIQIMIAYYCGVYLFYDVVPALTNWLGFILTFVAAFSIYKNHNASTTFSQQNEKQWAMP